MSGILTSAQSREITISLHLLSPCVPLGGWLALGHINSIPKHKPVLDTAQSAQAVHLQAPEPASRATFLREVRLPGRGEVKELRCTSISPASPIPMSTPMFPLLNLAVGFPRFSPRGCSNFAGQKFLPRVVTLQSPLYLSTKTVEFPGDFFP